VKSHVCNLRIALLDDATNAFSFKMVKFWTISVLLIAKVTGKFTATPFVGLAGTSGLVNAIHQRDLIPQPKLLKTRLEISMFPIISMM
jgi:hypothetical protein